jgi:peptide deformylase
MKFEIIPNEQTPVVDEIEDIELFFIKNIYKLIAFKEFAETLTHAAGLAANQCSIDGQRFMIRAFALKNWGYNPYSEANRAGYSAGETWKVVIDPKIIEYIGIKEIKCEGCLTWVGKKVVAERSRAVSVSYYDEEGVKHIEVYKGFDAQVWQHEINHLNGIPEQIEEYDYREPKQLDVGRNDICPCGSEKKYKHCCLLLL